MNTYDNESPGANEYRAQMGHTLLKFSYVTVVVDIDMILVFCFG